jgi:GT2 family glycosyltransferase
MSLSVRVVVPTHDRREQILLLARDLLGQDFPDDRLRIVVVCDGCRDGTADALRVRFGETVSVLEQPGSGPAAARNLGVRDAAEDLFVFLDDDMRVGPDLVERHVDAHRRHPGSVVVGSMPVHPGSPRSFLTEGLARWARRRDEALSTAGTQPGFEEVLTGNLSVGRETFARIGGFDVGFTQGESFGDEDLEFGWRAVEAGVPIRFEPRAVAAQDFRKRFRDVASDIRRGGFADVRFAAKHPEARRRLLLDGETRLPPWERRAMRFGRDHPRAAGVAAMPVVALLDGLARAGARGERLEHAHAVLRALVYGIGVAEGLSAQIATRGPKRR